MFREAWFKANLTRLIFIFLMLIHSVCVYTRGKETGQRERELKIETSGRAFLPTFHAAGIVLRL